jgi:sugar phosphate isomerase/epimerase
VALAATRAAGVPFDSIHGHFGEDIDPCSLETELRDHALRVYRDEARLAKELGGPMVVVHAAPVNPGRRCMTPEEAAASQALRWPKLRSFLIGLAEVAEREQVTFLLENLPYNCAAGQDAPALARLVLSMGSDRVRMCFDTGHAHIAAGKPGLHADAPSVAEALRQCAPAVAYLHIHDNDGTDDQHRWPGDGSIDWSAVAAVLRETGLEAPRMLEVFAPEAEIEAVARSERVARIREMLVVEP